MYIRSLKYFAHQNIIVKNNFPPIFLSKVIKIYVFQHFHYFGHFCGSSSFFPCNWTWTASLPAFKTLLNSVQLEKNKKHNDPTNIMPTWNIFWKYFSSIFCQKSLKLTFFQHFHYFGHFCCSSSFFQGNWPWTARLPAFKSLSNSGQVEKLREIRTEKIFCTKIFFAKNIFPQFFINGHKNLGFSPFSLFRALSCLFLHFPI